MKYMLLATREDQQQLMATLATMPAFLATRFGAMTDDEARERANGMPSPVEQVWHLADLELEGFGVRIERLLNEDNPQLADFDGTAIGERRNYQTKSLRQGMIAFARARADNIEALARVTPAQWTRRGEQDGVGRVSLCDIPAMMAEHDAAHRAEIEAWSARGATAGVNDSATDARGRMSR
jgi:DinB superfamily